MCAYCGGGLGGGEGGLQQIQAGLESAAPPVSQLTLFRLHNIELLTEDMVMEGKAAHTQQKYLSFVCQMFRTC